MEDRMQDKELISALADGQLQGEAFARGVQAACADRAGLATWHAYHLIGDVLRSGELARGAAADGFMQKLSVRLAQEQSLARPQAATPAPVTVRQPAEPAANDGSFRWKMVAGVASVAAFAAVGWSVIGTATSPTTAAQPQLAAAPQQQGSSAPGGTVLARTEPGVMIRDPKLDEMLAAHRQFGGASALQMPAGFLRSATFEGPAR
jgi:sigma-E factor negative regulatory protein RseA